MMELIKSLEWVSITEEIIAGLAIVVISLWLARKFKNKNNKQTGITDKGIEAIVHPYKLIISNLERQIKQTDNDAEKIELSTQLNQTKQTLAQKQAEITNLKELLTKSDTVIINKAKLTLNEKGIKATLVYLQGEEATQQEQKLHKNMQQWAKKYQLEAQLLIIDNQYQAADKAYQNMLRYDNGANYLFAYAHFLQKQNNFNQAIAYYQQSLDKYQLLAKTNPAVYQADVAATLNNLANLYSDNNQHQEAETAFDEALSIYRNLPKTNPAVYQADVAMTLNNLAILYLTNNQHQEAETAFDEALSIRRDLAKTNPEAYQPYVATNLNNLAVLYSDNNQHQKAETAHDEALSIRRDLAKTNPAVYQDHVAETLNNLANLYSDNNQHQQAETAYDEALSIRRDLAKTNPEAYQPYVATTLNNLAILYSDNNQHQQAETAYDEALSIYRDLAKIHPKTYNIALANILVMGFDFLKKPKTQLTEAKSLLLPFIDIPEAKKLLNIIAKFE